MNYRWLVLSLILVFQPVMAQVKLEPRECVILLHGLMRTGWSMWPVAWALEEEGYAIANITYPSLWYPIETLAHMAVDDGLSECSDMHTSAVNFVTHSLGGILVRQYLNDKRISNLGRVVMLAPPNQGSQVADYVQEWALARLLEPEAVLQLGTGERSIPLALGAVDFPLGVIAGTVNRREYVPGAPQGVSDGTVTTAETRVPGMLDYLEVEASHTFIMWNDEALRQTALFLRRGGFEDTKAVYTVPLSP